MPAGKPLEDTPLNPKQQRFVEEYLVDLNSTQAAIRAGYSEKTAHVIGCENLNKLNIAKAIQNHMDKRSKRTEITAERVLEEIAKMGFASMGDYATWNGGAVVVTPSDKLTPDQLAAVSEVTETSNANGAMIKVKLHDKKGSLELLGRHLKLFTDKTETELSGSLEISEVRRTVVDPKSSDS